MIDFLMISTRSTKRGVIEIYPRFIIKKSSDLMIRGGDFYAIWLEDRGLWSTNEQDALALIDRELDKFAEENKGKFDANVKVLHMWDAESGMIDRWHKYCQKQMRDSFHMLDENLLFSNSGVNKEDYASKRLNYPLEAGDHSGWDELIGTLYSPEERHKIEWAIGSIVNGDSKSLQKFMVFYGSAGTGKSTILNIIQSLFEGYYSVFDAKALGSTSNSFALESFKTNPLVAIQHDGDLSRIEDNTRLNSLVSHELMTVNEKFKSTYASRFKAFLFMGTNRPVKITDAKSGLIRRLIDVSPSGEKLSAKEYRKCVKKASFELGAIAQYCKDVYEDNPNYYDDYIPVNMMGASNDFYNFVMDNYHDFKKDDGITAKVAWNMYKTYCEEMRVSYPLSYRLFKEELKNYFWDYKERYVLDDGTRVRSYYEKFRAEKFEENNPNEKDEPTPDLIEFSETVSLFDEIAKEYPAQYTSDNGTPMKKWDSVTTTLNDIDTTQLHYVKVPLNHIVIDFDIPDENGNKSYEKNLKEASKWPATYAELSKSGAGIHLHYIYTGDPELLERLYAEHIEIKVFTGNSSLRRMLSKCNNLPIATISSGLPTKGEKKVVNDNVVQTEARLKATIVKCLNKEYDTMPSTKQNIDFIHKLLTDAYDSGLEYDVSNLYNDIYDFAMSSTHQAQYCMKLVRTMPMQSEVQEVVLDDKDKPIAFYDIEVFPNLFLVNWKLQGEDQPVHREINPSPDRISEIIKSFRLVGFNCRRYDNHLMYARSQGFSLKQLYSLSKSIVEGDKTVFFRTAYNLSYTDVYDFCSKKQSLKKWEIELGIHHQELGLAWDEPVPEEMWELVAEYCDNDVIATEAVWNARQADFIAREVLADVAGMTVNDTTNTLTTKIIFGNEKNPQSSFNYRNMGLPSSEDTVPEGFDDWTRFDTKGRPVFPDYIFDAGKSTYRGEEVGEGGYVYAEPGMYGNVALLDIASMHPHSILAEELFGPYTQRFRDIVEARIAIKHKDFDRARTMLDGSLAKYLDDPAKAKDLAQALKIAINSVYGLTSARFAHPFKDPRNKDNIVAKRGALFMVNLKHEVQKRGFTVAHIKTDSIKIPDATPEIIQFVSDYGAMYGYTFEHEATYERMCLVNDAVYIAKYDTKEHCEEQYGYIPGDIYDHPGEWTATGTQFQIPYVFKTLFSHEDIEFNDLCETKAVSTQLYLDMNENLLDVSKYEQIRDLRGKDESKLTNKERDLIFEYRDMTDDQLKEAISKGHAYQFIGKVGSFCPIKNGCGGGELMREKDGKYYAATGSKGYRWLDSEIVKNNHKEDDIDKRYYETLVEDAITTISEYGDISWFTSDDPYVGPEYIMGDYGLEPLYYKNIA